MCFEDWEGKCELVIEIRFDEYNSIQLRRYSGYGDYFDHFSMDVDFLKSLKCTSDFIEALKNDQLYSYKYGEFIDLDSVLKLISNYYGRNYKIDKDEWYVDKNGYGLSGDKVIDFYDLYLKYMWQKELFIKQLELILQYTEIKEIFISKWYSFKNDGNDCEYRLRIKNQQLSFIDEMDDDMLGWV